VTAPRQPSRPVDEPTVAPEAAIDPEGGRALIIDVRNVPDDAGRARRTTPVADAQQTGASGWVELAHAMPPGPDVWLVVPEDGQILLHFQSGLKVPPTVADEVKVTTANAGPTDESVQGAVIPLWSKADVARRDALLERVETKLAQRKAGNLTKPTAGR